VFPITFRPLRGLFFASIILLVLLKQTSSTSRFLQNEDDEFEYEATTDVAFLLDVAMDIADIRSTEDVATKNAIYMDGKNAFYEYQNGTLSQITLSGLSLGSSLVMTLDPIYNLYRNAFFDLGVLLENDSTGNFDGRPVDEYANTLVEDLFELNSTRAVSIGALILNVWMSVMHELNVVLTSCADNGETAKDDMNAALDRGAALWIGAGQSRGDNEEGYLLYNLAEVAGERFGQDQGETIVNANVMSLINSIQIHIESGSCGDELGYVDMRSMIQDVTSFMTVPLIQTLIHHIMNVENEGVSDMVELYTLAMAPRVAACDPSVYDSLIQSMVIESLDSSDKQYAIELLERVYSCLDVSCVQIGSYLSGRVPQCNDSDDSKRPLAGYTPLTDVREKSYIDRDINQMRVMMDWGAYDAAQDIYLYGQHSVYSLSDLATNKAFLHGSKEFDLFQTYYGISNHEYVEQTILDVLELLPPYDQASNDQRVEIVIGLLQSVVMYLSISSALESAIEECEKNPDDTSAYMHLWDAGAAYYVGSIEGTSINGTNSGKSLFRAAANFCDPFDTCEPDTAEVNKIILDSFANGQQSLSNKGCSQAKMILQGTIAPAFFIPLIQGTLLYASLTRGLQAGTQDPNFGSMYAYSRSVLPYINSVKISSATIIADSMDLQFTVEPLQAGLVAVLNAFRDALPRMPTDCKDIGVLGMNGGLCPLSPAASPTSLDLPSGETVGTVLIDQPSSGSSITNTTEIETKDIAFGRYIFSSESVAEMDSSLSLDVKEVRFSENNNNALRVYKDGFNLYNGVYGMVDVNSLALLSTEAHNFMNEDPAYNFFRYALYDQQTFEPEANITGNASWPFADMVVRLAFSSTSGKNLQLAGDASVVLNTFFLIQHRLYRAARECEQGLDPSNLIDSAVALWIGREQLEGKFDSGWMMYSIAQQARKSYGLDEREAQVNTDLMTEFKEALVLSEFCPSQPETFLELRVLVSKTIKNLAKPVMQQLLYYVSIDTLDFVELYALAVIPYAVSCDEDLYQELREMFLTDFKLDSTVNEAFYDKMTPFLQCMRFTCADLGDTRNSNLQLQEIVSLLCSRLDSSEKDKMLAGYTPWSSSNVTEASRIDLDVRQIEIFMKTRSYIAAAEYYKYGENSMKAFRSTLSLQWLASSSNWEDGVYFLAYSDYFGLENYADGEILKALLRKDVYSNASRLQLSSLVVRTLQTMVMYTAVLSQLQSGVNECKKSSKQNIVQQDLDTAVAYYVGSLEGSKVGGKAGGHGQLFFGVANELCHQFDACTDSGNANVNRKIMAAIVDMQTALAESNCDSAMSTLTYLSETALPVPLVQGTLEFAFANEQLPAQSTSSAVVEGSVFAGAILPLINSIDSNIANTLFVNMAYNPTGRPVSDGADAVFDVFVQTLGLTGIDCNDVGTLRSEARNVCQPLTASQPTRPELETSTSLGNDLYVSTTYVQDRANIAIDIKEMEQALKDGRQNFAQLIYSEGKNSDVFNNDGLIISHRSMGDFSIKGTDLMVDEPIFNIFVYALQDESGLYLGKDANQYANTLVEDAFNLKSSSQKTVASEASVALNLWMYVTHVLYTTLRKCKSGEMPGDDGIHSIDEAVAYWIGDGQIAGNAERGHLLYALAEKMGDEFSINTSGQSRTNTNILRLFHQAKIELSNPSACSDDPTTYRRLYHIVNKIVSIMTVPLVQGLIHNIRKNDAARVKIYANAFIPLISACDPSTFAYLRDKLIFGTYNVVEIDVLIDRINSILPCLGLECDDIGIHSSEFKSSCVDEPNNKALAGYRPASNVKEFSQLDLDILEMDILLQMGAYDAVDDLYSYGKHTITPHGNGFATSLGYLATTSGRSVVPQFDSFVRYYDGDENYADTIVRNALTSTDFDMSTKRLLVVRTCQYVVLFMAALQSFNDAISDCESNAAAGAMSTSEFWDKGAALLIGHLEGAQNGGTNDGELLFALAKENCVQFGTCSSPSSAAELSAEVNDRIETLLYSGRGAVLGNSCWELRRVTTKLEPLMLIPMIQATLNYALTLSNSNGNRNGISIDHVEAHVISSALLPLVDAVNRDSALTLAKNFDLSSSQSRNTGAEVFSAFAEVYAKLGVSCDHIGAASGINACKGAGDASANSKTIMGLVMGILIVLFTLLGLICLRRATISNHENDPTFEISKGELNHIEDLITKGAVSDDTYDTDAHYTKPNPLEDDDNVRVAILSKTNEQEVEVV